MISNKILFLNFISKHKKNVCLLILLGIMSMSGFNVNAQELKTIDLIPTDDAYVVVDLNDPDNIKGQKNLNTGDLDFLKLWYAWNVTESQEKIATLVYLKFNLRDQNPENIINANLKMRPFATFLAEAKPVSVVYVPDNNWSESEITYETRPQYPPEDIISTNIENIEEWYSWDLTDLVRENIGSELSIVLRFYTIHDKTEELVTFYSKEAKHSPYLEIKYSEPTINTTSFLIIGGIIAVVAGGIVVKYLKKKPSHKIENTKISAPKEPRKFQCKNCGKTVLETFKLCPFCGTTIN